MEAGGYFVDKVMYTCFIKEYCKDKNVTMACGSDEFAYMIIIYVYARTQELMKQMS